MIRHSVKIAWKLFRCLQGTNQHHELKRLGGKFLIDIVVVAKSMNKEMLRLQSGKEGNKLNHGDKAGVQGDYLLQG